MEPFHTECRNLGSLRYEMSLKVSAVQVQKAFDREYKNVQKKLSLPGFRKGKVPLDHIRRNYSEKIKYDVAQSLLEEGYALGLNQNNLRPAGPPKVDFKSIDENQDFQCTLLFETHPKIEVKEFENFTLKIKKSKVTDKEVDQVIEDLRESHSTLIPVLEDRPSKTGDVLAVDLSGTVEGGAVLPPQKDFSVELGKKQVMADIENGLLGVKPGDEKKISSRFNKNHTQFPDKKAEFFLKVKKISVKKKPEVNDEWAKKLNEKSVESLRQNIFERLEKNAKQYDQDQLRGEALKQLADKNPMEIPPSMIAQQKQSLMASTQQRFKSQGVSPDQIQEYLKKHDKELEEESRKSVHVSYLIHALCQKLKIEENSDHIKAELQKNLNQNQVDPHLVDQVRWQRMQTRVLDYIIKHSPVIEE